MRLISTHCRLFGLQASKTLLRLTCCLTPHWLTLNLKMTKESRYAALEELGKFGRSLNASLLDNFLVACTFTDRRLLAQYQLATSLNCNRRKQFRTLDCQSASRSSLPSAAAPEPTPNRTSRWTFQMSCMLAFLSHTRFALEAATCWALRDETSTDSFLLQPACQSCRRRSNGLGRYVQTREAIHVIAKTLPVYVVPASE